MFASGKPPLRVFTLGISAILLPATLLLAFAVLRSLQPLEYQPAHISWIVLNWTATHISRLDAGVLFLGMPALAVFLGCVVLVSVWRDNPALRQDVREGIAVMRRHLAVALLATATLVGAAILALVVSHLFVD
jgi:hypothetical protein